MFKQEAQKQADELKKKAKEAAKEKANDLKAKSKDVEKVRKLLNSSTLWFREL